MAVDISTPVSAIEGIGPNTAGALTHVAVWTVFDLLRVRFNAIHQAVRPMASTDEVRAWRRMAMLLQVSEVTPQWAEALVQNKIDTIDELARKRIDEIDALMREAKERGIIPDTPTIAQIAEMIKDAAILRYTGLLAGTVVDPEGNPLPAATLRVGPAQGESDARGRFRVLRIPLGKTIALQITHPDFDALIDEHPKIATDIGVAGGGVFQLKPSGTESPEPITLSELHGDAVPATYRKTQQVMMSPGELRDGDLLVVGELYSSAPDARLVSRLKSYRNGELLIHSVRLPLSRLPGEVRLKSQFGVSNGQLIPVEVSPGNLHRHKLRLRLRKTFGGRPRPATDDEKQAFVRDVTSFLAQNEYYRRR
jgi:hypothetical protein